MPLGQGVADIWAIMSLTSGRASSSSKRPPEARYGNFAMTGSLKTPST